MKTECDRRAVILTAEGVKQSAALTAEGKKQSAILRAEGQVQSTILRAQGEMRAILQVFDATHRGNVDPKLLPYEYIKTFPQVVDPSSSKLWTVPTEVATAFNAVTKGLGSHGGDGGSEVDFDGTGKIADALAATALSDIDNALADAKGVADAVIDEAEILRRQSGRHFDPDAETEQRPTTPAPPELRSFDQEGPNGNGIPPAGQ